MAHKQNGRSYSYQAAQSGYNPLYSDTAYSTGYPSSYGSSMASTGSQGSYTSPGSSYGSGSTSPRFPSSKYCETSFGSTSTPPGFALSPGDSRYGSYSNSYVSSGYNDSYSSTPNPLMFRHENIQTPYGQYAVSEKSTATDMVNFDETLSLSPELPLQFQDTSHFQDPSTFSLDRSTVNGAQTGLYSDGYEAYTYQTGIQDSLHLNSSHVHDELVQVPPDKTGARKRDPKSTKSFPCLIVGCPSADKGAKFTRLADLQRHDRTVHNPQPQDCPHGWCGRVGKKGFTRKDHLNEHLKGFHVGQLEPPMPRPRRR